VRIAGMDGVVDGEGDRVAAALRVDVAGRGRVEVGETERGPSPTLHGDGAARAVSVIPAVADRREEGGCGLAQQGARARMGGSLRKEVAVPPHDGETVRLHVRDPGCGPEADEVGCGDGSGGVRRTG